MRFYSDTIDALITRNEANISIFCSVIARRNRYAVVCWARRPRFPGEFNEELKISSPTHAACDATVSTREKRKKTFEITRAENHQISVRFILIVERYCLPCNYRINWLFVNGEDYNRPKSGQIRSRYRDISSIPFLQSITSGLLSKLDARQSLG